MADGSQGQVLTGLKDHVVRIANIPQESLSTLAKKGDEQLVEQFLSENIGGQESLQSQLYIACFWGAKDSVKQLLNQGADVNAQNPKTLWTPLHAATFQEHGPVVMLLLDEGAVSDMQDSYGRTPIDFASASDKIWPHFASLSHRRITKADLVLKGILRKTEVTSGIISPKTSPREPGQGIQMASYSHPEAVNGAPFMQAASTGDVLADEKGSDKSQDNQPQFAMWK